MSTQTDGKKRLVMVEFSGRGPRTLEPVLKAFAGAFPNIARLDAESLLEFFRTGAPEFGNAIRTKMGAKNGDGSEVVAIQRVLFQMPGEEPKVETLVIVPNMRDLSQRFTLRFLPLTTEGGAEALFWRANIDYGPAGSSKRATLVHKLIDSFYAPDSMDIGNGKRMLPYGGYDLLLASMSVIFMMGPPEYA